ncbi:hypothetical protein PG994_010566 [Apiospora phragmitis]|uniref:Uncharacterized protein n=1 Tax=Apiospora phragmitis TaxID=2905665 RepID=A0ABR1TQ95_9PEZI
MAVRRYALLALAGAALAQMEGQMPMSSSAAAAGASTMPPEAVPMTDAASSPMYSLPITTDTPSSARTTTPSSMPMVSSQSTMMASSMTSKMSTMTTMHTTAMGGMPMGTGGVMSNGTSGSGGKEPPISGAGANVLSIGLFSAAALVSTAMLQ